MDHRFTQTLAEQRAYFTRRLKGFHDGGTWAGVYLQELMFSLATIEASLACAGDPATEARVRGEIADALAPLGNQVRAYAQVVADEAETSEEDILAEQCARRSALEYVLARYPATPAASLIERADLARFDDELRRLVRAQGPLPAAEVPAGIPRSHWWWYATGEAAGT